MTVAPLRLDKNNRLTLRVQAVISFIMMIENKFDQQKYKGQKS